MKTTYNNRYGDQIQFEVIDENKITMTGYGDTYRVSSASDYSEAYEIYKLLCQAADHPDVELFIDDPTSNTTRMMNYQEFAEHMKDIADDPAATLYSLIEHVKLDPNRTTMFDPTGGPYIELGTDIGRYFDGKLGKQIVSKIDIGKKQVTFTTKSK